MLTAPRPESNKKTYEPVPAGTHVARLYRLVQIGTVESVWQGETKNLMKIWLSFELCNEKKVFKEGEPAKPMTVSVEYTLSMGPKANLRKFVEGMIGTALKDEEADGFDVETLVGKACLINVSHTKKGDKTYVNVMSASPLIKGMEAPAQFNPSMILTYQKWDSDVYETLPNFIKDKMATTPEMATRAKYDKNKEESLKAQEKYDANEIDPEDIPFA
jgi:hypothetical protein